MNRGLFRGVGPTPLFPGYMGPAADGLAPMVDAASEGGVKWGGAARLFGAPIAVQAVSSGAVSTIFTNGAITIPAGSVVGEQLWFRSGGVFSNSSGAGSTPIVSIQVNGDSSIVGGPIFPSVTSAASLRTWFIDIVVTVKATTLVVSGTINFSLATAGVWGQPLTTFPVSIGGAAIAYTLGAAYTFDVKVAATQTTNCAWTPDSASLVRLQPTP